MKILITGGHVTPALALIDELKKRRGIEIIFVGRRYALDHDKTESFEYKSVQERNVSFTDLRAGRFTRIMSFQSLFNLLRIPTGFIKAYTIVSQTRPDRILTFGGYIALPIAVAGFVLGVPVYTHEQTLVPGVANRIIGRFAKKVFVTFGESASAFPADKTVMTGNPVRREVFETGRAGFKIPLKHKNASGKKVIFITGGSLGSHSLNKHIEKILPALLRDFVVIHQCGDTREHDDYSRLSKFKSPNYIVKKHLTDGEIGSVYGAADLVVARGGANTVMELVALRKPAVFVPLPWGAGGEQRAHAVLLEAAGVALVFDQEDDSRVLLTKIIDVAAHLARYRKKFDKLKQYYDPLSAQKIIAYVVSSDNAP